MIEYAKSITIDKHITNTTEIKAWLASGTPALDIYFICLDNESAHLAEILHTPEILKPPYAGRSFLVIGMADGRGRAKQLFSDIVQKYLKTGSALADFKKYYCDEGAEA